MLVSVPAAHYFIANARAVDRKGRVQLVSEGMEL